MTPTEALIAAAEAVGSQHKLVQALGLRSQGTFQNWLAAGGAPPHRVLAIEGLTGISRHLLRPDIYPDPSGVEL